MRGRLGYDSPNREWEVFKYHDTYHGDKPWGVYHPGFRDTLGWPDDFNSWQDAMDFVNEHMVREPR